MIAMPETFRPASTESRSPEPPSGAAAVAAPAGLAWLRELYDREAGFVRGLVRRLGGPDAEAEDLTHEVFLVALKRASELRRREDPRGFLVETATRLVSAGRRRARVRRLLGLRLGPGPSTEQRSPHVAFEAREAAARLYRALDGLSEKKRAAFILLELQELPGEQVAQALGVPVQTVWTRVFHARRELKRKLSRLEGPTEESP